MLLSCDYQKPPCLTGREVYRFFRTLSLLAPIVALCQLFLQQLCFDRAGITNGELWRLFTCHFTHSSGSHAFWDVLALSGSITWLGIYSARAILPAAIMGIVFVDILLLSGYASVPYYCGLSGMLFSPLLVAAYLHARFHRNFPGYVPLAVIVLKLLVDLLSRQTLIVDTAWSAYPESHLAGLLAGCVVVLLIRTLPGMAPKLPDNLILK